MRRGFAVRRGGGSDVAFPKRIGAAALGLAILMGSGLSAPPAQATFIVTLEQEGSNVVATGSGTIDLAGLCCILPGAGIGAIGPAAGLINVGPSSLEPTDYYSGLFSGPTGFGTGLALTFASSGSGDAVGYFGQELYVPEGYVSVSALKDSSTYDNQTLSSLGLTPGVYVQTFGANTDRFIVDVVSAQEPASALLLGAPLGLVMLLAARRGRAAA
jgi:hypothetical protein